MNEYCRESMTEVEKLYESGKESGFEDIPALVNDIMNSTNFGEMETIEDILVQLEIYLRPYVDEYKLEKSQIEHPDL